MSRDHKPWVYEEKDRIVENWGIIKQKICNGGSVYSPYVYTSEEDKNGLRVTRSIGNSQAKVVGVISEPDINIYDIDENDRYLILASEPVWNQLPNSNIVQLTHSFMIDG